MTSIALVSAARDRAATSEEKGLRQEQDAKGAHREALWSQANEAMLRSGLILDRNPPREHFDREIVEPILKVLAVLGRKPDLPTAEAIQSLRSYTDLARQLRLRDEAQGREAAEPELRKVIAILEGLGGEVPEPRLVRFYLARSYFGLGIMELTRVTNAMNPVKYLLVTQATLSGKPPKQPEVENALANIQKALELIPLSSPPPSEPEALQELEREAWTVQGLALARLGRFTECLISLDRALPLTQGPAVSAIRNLRLIFLVPAEVEQSHMPWSPPNRVDHDRAMRMADYLAGQPNVSQAALFNAACVFSLASLDDRANTGERVRRASRAVTLLALIEGKGYFRGTRQAQELREDKDLDPLRSMSDFQALAARVAKGG
jgi:tetratricopeptide (TPR) repeat protein